jgi:hypothetical protein
VAAQLTINALVNLRRRGVGASAAIAFPDDVFGMKIGVASRQTD